MMSAVGVFNSVIGAVKDRVILDFHLNIHPSCDVEVVSDGTNVGRQARGHDPIDRKDRPAEKTGHARYSLILHRKDEGERTRRMSGDRNRSHRDVAHLDRLTFANNQVSLRSSSRILLIRVRIRGVHRVPVCGRRADSCTEPGLEILRAAKMVTVAVTEQDVFDLRQIEAELLQPWNQNRLNPVRVAGIEQSILCFPRDPPRHRSSMRRWYR